MSLVSFDGAAKIIQVLPGVTELDVKVDLYSEWKEWVLLSDNSKYPEAFTSVGGDPITATQFLGSTFFLQNGWRIRMRDGDHMLSVIGNLYTAEPGGDPYLPPVGNYKVTIETQRSNLIDTISSGSGLSNEQATQLAELWKLSGLDPAAPLVVSPDSREAGVSISQTIERSNDPPDEQTVTVTRDP